MVCNGTSSSREKKESFFCVFVLIVYLGLLRFTSFYFICIPLQMYSNAKLNCLMVLFVYGIRVTQKANFHFVH